MQQVPEDKAENDAYTHTLELGYLNNLALCTQLM